MNSSRTGPLMVPSGIADKRLGSRIRSRTLIFSTQRSNFSPSAIPIWSNFVRLSGDHKMLEKVFSHSCVSCIFFSSVWKLNAPPCILFPGAWVVGDTNNSTSSGSTMEKICPQHYRLVAFFFCQGKLMTPIHNCSVDTEPIDRVNCLEQEFCIYRISIIVNGTSAFPFLQDPTTQSAGAFEDRMKSL